MSANEAAQICPAVIAEIEKCDAVILSDYGKGVFGTNLASAIITAAHKAGKSVIVDPKGSSCTKYRNATVITPNRQEIALATGLDVSTSDALVAAAQNLRALTGAKAILVTRAGEGMTLVTDKIEHLPAESREVSDVTSAGDTVAAILAIALAGGAGLADAPCLANVAASIVVGRRGTAVATTADIAAALVHSGIADFERKIVDPDTAANP